MTFARWLAGAARREARSPSLFGALLSGRVRAYAFHRLRFMVPRTLLGLVLHAAEVYLLTLALPWEYFAPLLSYRAGAALIGGAHWGALETLRRRVRDELAARRPERARSVIEAFLFATSACAGLCALLLGVLLLVFRGGGITLFDAYGIACFVRLLLELCAGTYHSGIYAARRVYRPFSAAVGPDLLELATLIALWRPLGAWGIALSIVLVGILRASVTWYYAARAYDRSRMRRPLLRRGLRHLHWLSWVDLRDAARHMLANGGSQLDALLLLVLARAHPTPEAGFTLGVVYTFRPILALAHGWPRAFYPDLKLVERGMHRLFVERLHRLLLRTATFVALSAGGAIVILSSLLMRGLPPPVVFLLAALCLVRARYAVEQTEAFALAQHGRSLRLALPVLTTLSVTGVLRAQQLVTLGALLLTLAGSALLDARWRRRESEEPTSGTLLSLPLLFGRLTRTDGPVCATLLTVDRRVTTRDKLARTLAGTLEAAQLARLGTSQLLCLPGAGNPRLALLAATGGAVRQLTVYEAASGPALIEVLRRAPTLAALLSDNAQTLTLPALCARFEGLFPDGQLLDLRRLHPSAVALAPAEQRSLLRAVLMHARTGQLRPPAGSRQHVALYAPLGTPEAAFIVSGEAPMFSAFAEQVLCASISAALAPRATV